MYIQRYFEFTDEFTRTHAVTEELCPGNKSIVKVVVEFMRAVTENPAMRQKIHMGF
jgi:hypothetical protein